MLLYFCFKKMQIYLGKPSYSDSELIKKNMKKFLCQACNGQFSVYEPGVYYL